eukprot:augustus_masked-scaffold_18-processed-gene-5.12-mRNA-1 protein AED:0.02 eAED:0.02 QI:0/-1/0/1/-1/1/1/0/449
MFMKRFKGLLEISKQRKNIPIGFGRNKSVLGVSSSGTEGLVNEPSFGTSREHPWGEYSPLCDIEVPDVGNKRLSYRVLDEDGVVLNSKEAIDVALALSEAEAISLMKSMIKVEVVDSILYEIQRQGRISFYMTSNGEEGINIGSADSLSEKDTIFAQYREAGVLLHRGYTFGEMMDQCFGTMDDAGKGRQMPVHYTSRRLNWHTISSPLATQMPHATGAAYALKMKAMQEERPLDEIVVCYFGEGAASEGDFHPALNFAATLEAPVLFLCRNNGYAISTPASEQFKGDGIVSRAIGYGMASIRVDGNCVLAMKEATKQARQYIVENSKPVLLEAMSYRQGHHSTSDDSTRYRDLEEIEHFRMNYHPITRFSSFLLAKGWWNEEEDHLYRKTIRKEVLKAVKTAEAKPKPTGVDELFNDVYKDMPLNLRKQRQELIEHLEKYPDEYRLDH